MKNPVFGLAFAFAVTVATAQLEVVQADPWYTVNANGIPLMEYSNGGKVRCTAKGGTTVHRHWGENWSERIFVRVTSFPDNWNCQGWALKMFLTPHVKSSGQWYKVDNWSGAEMKTEPGGGTLKCHVPRGKFLIRNNRASANNDTWIYVRWRDWWKGNSLEGYWDVRDRKCYDWNQHGWVLKSDLVAVDSDDVKIRY